MGHFFCGQTSLGSLLPLEGWITSLQNQYIIILEHLSHDESVSILMGRGLFQDDPTPIHSAPAIQGA